MSWTSKGWVGWTKLLTRLGCRGPEASELYTIADGFASLETLLNFPESQFPYLRNWEW